jgi:sortase A
MNPGRQFRRPLATIAFTLLAVGAALAAGPLTHGIIYQMSSAQAKSIWEKWKRSQTTHADTASPNPGEPILWLRVPSRKISTLVLQESDAEALHRFPAARRLNSGGCVVFAHRDIHFRSLANIRIGDEIRVETADDNRATYTVRSTRILLPEQVSAALDDPENAGSLHLLTCYPFRYIGAAPKRFLVTATERK